MSKDVVQYQRPSVEDYFSDNAEGQAQRRQLELLQSNREGAFDRKTQCVPRKMESGLAKIIAGKWITEAQLNAQLDKLNIPGPNDPMPEQAIIRDQAFRYISELLQRFGQPEWSLRPRTFCILRMLGCVKAMSTFVAEKRTDFFLPYNHRNLPNAIQGQELRSKFLRLQKVVTSPHHGELEKEGSAHIHFHHLADDQFWYINPLGVGKFGVVDFVRGNIGLGRYARKRIQRGASALKDGEVLNQFENELTALKTLRHRHLVKLISSYTDPFYVGLIMTPVADQDLEVFLKRKLTTDTELNLRKQLLRTFYGCLTSALVYLHSKSVRHKDIKARNVLVKDTNILFSDFGTAKVSGEDGRSTSFGAVSVWTPKYCAPEVADHDNRGRPSDIWSLGCVFLDMATVLNDHSMEEMDEFYEENGTQLGAISKNEEATEMWIEELKSSARRDDIVLFEWISWMLEQTPRDRPTADQLLGRILDTKSDHAFLCSHCLANAQNSQPGSIAQNELPGQDEPPLEVVTENLFQSFLQGDRPGQSTQDSEFTRQDDHALNEDDDAVTAIMLARANTWELSKEGGDVSDAGAGAEVKESDRQGPAKLAHPEATETKPDRNDGALTERAESRSVGPEKLGEDFNRSEATTSSQNPQIEATRDLAQENESLTVVNINAVTLVGQQPSSKPKSNDAKDLELPHQDVPPIHTHSKNMLPMSSNTDTNDPKDSKDIEIPEISEDGNLQQSTRFHRLPQDQRPLPSDTFEMVEEEEDTEIVPAEPLKPPPVDENDPFSVPKSTLVPSYILASANHFSLNEIRASEYMFGNLFVYGRFMFPSVLRSFAARSTKGVYSFQHQRRLNPSSIDWAKVDMSLTHAAEAMTPARLKGFDRWRPSGMECAVLQDSFWTSRILDKRADRDLPSMNPPPLGEVKGFLILGITEEAIRYCDMILSSDEQTLKRARFEDSKEQSVRNNRLSLLQRQNVAVEVRLNSGGYHKVSAFTYVWSQGIDDLLHPWKPERFIRGSHIRHLSDFDTIDWRREEREIARNLKMSYALAGDDLCSAILERNQRYLEDLLDKGYDANAPCRIYGVPLQAAVCLGDDRMVRTLLNHEADVNMKGGKYGTPLIAATIGSRKSITKLLLKARADVFADGGKYIGALYQAVGHSDWAITEMLLEAGAWLSKDYGEIMDLALEKNDSDVKELLLLYDIRGEYQKRIPGSRSLSEVSDRSQDEQRSLVKTSSRVLTAVMRKFVVVSGKSGSFKGRKGVEIARAAIKAGAPLVILDYIRGALDPIQKLIDVLKAADQAQEEANRQLAEDEQDNEDEVDNHSSCDEDTSNPTINVTKPREDLHPLANPLSNRSRGSSVQSVERPRRFYPGEGSRSEVEQPKSSSSIGSANILSTARDKYSPISQPFQSKISTFLSPQSPQYLSPNSNSVPYPRGVTRPRSSSWQGFLSQSGETNHISFNEHVVHPGDSLVKRTDINHGSPRRSRLPYPDDQRANLSSESSPVRRVISMPEADYNHDTSTPNRNHAWPGNRAYAPPAIQITQPQPEPYNGVRSTPPIEDGSLRRWKSASARLPEERRIEDRRGRAQSRDLYAGPSRALEVHRSSSRRSETVKKASCGGCNGIGWYREISNRGQRVRDVDCRNCNGSGRV